MSTRSPVAAWSGVADVAVRIVLTLRKDVRKESADADQANIRSRRSRPASTVQISGAKTPRLLATVARPSDDNAKAAPWNGIVMVTLLWGQYQCIRNRNYAVIALGKMTPIPPHSPEALHSVRYCWERMIRKREQLAQLDSTCFLGVEARSGRWKRHHKIHLRLRWRSGRLRLWRRNRFNHDSGRLASRQASVCLAMLY
jgi:hypothetical protein